jgi:eukaryotic-like serine/threonine-protein kinase
LLHRATCREKLLNYTGAIADLTAALTHENAPTRAYFHRSQIRSKNGENTGAEMDAAEGFKREPHDVNSWITRGYWKQSKDPKGALADYDHALAMDPRSQNGLLNKAVVLAEHLNRTADAVTVVDTLLDLYPYHTEARSARAVYLARLGDAKRAKDDAAIVLKEEPTAYRFYQMVGLYAQLSKTDKTGVARQQALQYAAKAFRNGFSNFQMIADDADVDPIRDDREFKDLVEHAKKLLQAGK